METIKALKQTPEYSIEEVTVWSDNEIEFFHALTNKLVRKKQIASRYLRVVKH